MTLKKINRIVTFVWNQTSTSSGHFPGHFLFFMQDPRKQIPLSLPHCSLKLKRASKLQLYVPVIASEEKLEGNLGSGPRTVGVTGGEEAKEPGKNFTAALCYWRLNGGFAPLLGQPLAAEVCLQL